MPNHPNRSKRRVLSDQEHATILAALGLWTVPGIQDVLSTDRYDALADVATNGHTLGLLDDGDVEQLCEDINLGAVRFP